jgi:hypothetical protein
MAATGTSAVMVHVDAPPPERLEVMAVDRRSARHADGTIGMLVGGRHHRALTGVWSPSLIPIAEQPHVIMPVVGRVSEATAVLTMTLPDDCALCDDGATVDCSKTAMGRIPYASLAHSLRTKRSSASRKYHTLRAHTYCSMSALVMM